jgi:uncharacterized protein YjbI with pentapeptide repeats
LVNCDLRGANLTDTDFEKADLTNADLRGAIVTGTKFPGTVLDHVKRDSENLRLLNRIICPTCRHKGAYWLCQNVLHGNPYTPASDTEVENFYRCANADCQHEWSDID